MENYDCKIDVDYGIAFEYDSDKKDLLASFADWIDTEALAFEIDNLNRNICVQNAGFYLESSYSTSIEFDAGYTGCGDIYEIECGEYCGELLYQTWDYSGRDFSYREGYNGKEIAEALVKALSMLQD